MAKSKRALAKVESNLQRVLPFAEWKKNGATLKRYADQLTQRAIQYQIAAGYWWNYGKDNYDRTLIAQVLRDLEWEKSTLENAAWVERHTRNVPERETLTYDHLKVLAAEHDQGKQVELAAMAREQKLSGNKLRAKIARDEHALNSDIETLEPPTTQTAIEKELAKLEAEAAELIAGDAIQQAQADCYFNLIERVRLALGLG